MSPDRILFKTAAIAAVICTVAIAVDATDYEVGSGPAMLPKISDVPWESLAPGDRVLIHWRATPYHGELSGRPCQGCLA